MITKTNHRRLETGGQHKTGFPIPHAILCPVSSLFLFLVSGVESEKHRLKVEIKKNRHGALGEAELEYVNEYTSLHEKF